jgi:sugar lactone lactonase YvrE
MAPGAPGAPPPPLGINGLHVRAGLLYFTNTQLGTFARVPLGGGAVEVLGVPQPGLYDDFAFDSEGRAWVTTSPAALTLFTRLKNGTWEQEIVVPGDAVGSTVLNGPSAAAFGRDGARETKILYVTTRAGQIVAVDTSSGHT